jgi:Glyoxalase-like domain
MHSTELDHLVVACRDLSSAEVWLNNTLGVKSAGGGQHLGFCTHNRLVSLGSGVYLELIALDPTQAVPVPPVQAPFNMQSPALQQHIAQGPRLIHWVRRVKQGLIDDLATDDLWHSPVPMSRGERQWRIALARWQPEQISLGTPTLIDWLGEPSAAYSLPESGLQLLSTEELPLRAKLATPLGDRWLA